MDKKLALEVIYPYKALQEVNKKESEDSKNSNWCGSGDSNPWPRPWQGRALNN